MAVLEVTGREAADPIAAIELCYSQGWTDGLPVIPPTDERVAVFLGHLKRGRDEVLGESRSAGVLSLLSKQQPMR